RRAVRGGVGGRVPPHAGRGSRAGSRGGMTRHTERGMSEPTNRADDGRTMRSVLAGLVVASVGALVAAPAGGSGFAVPNPCKLVTAADVRATVGATVSRGKLQSLGLYRSCTYTTTSSAFVTVQTRALSKADFVKSAKMNPGPVKAIGGLVAPA